MTAAGAETVEFEPVGLDGKAIAGGDFILRYVDDATQEVTTQTITVRFPDWCSGSNETAHWAIGPLSQRYRTQGSDGARCGIFHVPADVLPGKPAVEVELVWEPPWTPDRLSANAMRFMGW